MSDNCSAELEKLFDEWRKRHISEDYSNNEISKNNFIPDGIIDEASYMQSPKKILFIAKEAVCLDKTEKTAEENFETAQKDGFWCRRVVLGEEESGTRFSSGLALLANAILNENFETPEKDISALRYVAFMNINKRGGFTECETDLDAYVDKYKDLIDREIRIISPDIIVCCGMGVRGRLSGVDSCKSLPVLEVYHPSARYKTDTDRLKKLEDELKNAQF